MPATLLFMNLAIPADLGIMIPTCTGFPNCLAFSMNLINFSGSNTACVWKYSAPAATFLSIFASCASTESLHGDTTAPLENFGGCLPIMRFNYGAGNRDRLHSAFRYGTALVSGMMILGTLTVNFFQAQLLELFTASEAMRSFGISAMRIMAASYLFCGLSTMISTYFQATEKVGSSIAIQLCRQLLFLVPALWCLNKLFQLNGIWLAFPVAETATMLIALIIMAWHRHKNIL